MLTSDRVGFLWKTHVVGLLLVTGPEQNEGEDQVF